MAFGKDEPWFFRHFNKIFTVMFVGIILFWITVGVLTLMVGGEVKEHGLKSVVTCVWEGSDSEDCKDE